MDLILIVPILFWAISSYAAVKLESPAVFITAILFAVGHILFYKASFPGVYYFASSAALSAALLVSPAMSIKKDWALLLSVILTSCIFISLCGMINYLTTDSTLIVNLISGFNVIATIGELVILAMAANGRLGGSRIDLKGILGRRTIHTIRGEHHLSQSSEWSL